MYDLLTMNHEVVEGWSTLLLPTGGVGGAAGSSSGSPPPSPSIQWYRQQGTGTTRGHHPRYRATYCTLGWSDLALLAIFKFGHMLSISFIFFSSIPKNQ